LKKDFYDKNFLSVKSERIKQSGSRKFVFVKYSLKRIVLLLQGRKIELEDETQTEEHS
jgi:hypothetical protein